jgi:hypothetical protein
MRTAILVLAGVLIPSSLAAQTAASRLYLGASTAAETGARGPILGGAVPTVGALVGVRLGDAWSLEVELDRGFRITESSDEALWVSFALPGSTPEELERQGIRARFDRTQTAGPGAAVHVMWRPPKPGRVTAGLFGGLAARAYTSRVVRTPVWIGPGVSPDRPATQPADEARDMTGVGLSGGVAIFTRLTPGLTIAPEFRLTSGIITNDPYWIFRAAVRVLWGF